MTDSAADRVNCYLPRALKQQFRELHGAEGSFSEILRLGVIEANKRAREKASA